MKKPRIFIYPIGDPDKSNSKNPYIDDLINSLKPFSRVVNENSYSSLGILQAFQYYFRSEVFIFNWTENIPSRRLGKLQFIFFYLLCLLIKITDKKLVWILHNKEPHVGHSSWSKKSMKISGVYSSFIITHAKEGIDFIKEKYKKTFPRVMYFPHPVSNHRILETDNRQIEYDYIVWGAIERYKGILEFLRYFVTDSRSKNKRILICGKCADADYLQALKKYESANVNIKEGFIAEHELHQLISKSSSILFLYTSSSILSSGALTKSLNYGKPIIGPEIGAFKDMGELGLVQTFKDYSDISKLDTTEIDTENLQNYLSKNTWNNLGKSLKIKLQL